MAYQELCLPLLDTLDTRSLSLDRIISLTSGIRKQNKSLTPSIVACRKQEKVSERIIGNINFTCMEKDFDTAG